MSDGTTPQLRFETERPRCSRRPRFHLVAPLPVRVRGTEIYRDHRLLQVAYTLWSKLGVQRPAASVAELLGEVANVTVATNHRYVWRGVRDAHYELRSSLDRRLQKSGIAVTADSLRHYEASLIQRASESRFGPGLSRAELLALLQHVGAATPLLDVTPDPFVALFFATEPVGDESKPCALMAIRVPGKTEAAQAAHTLKGPLADGGPDESVYDRIRSELTLPVDTVAPLLWEAPFVDDRMRAQRGMFLATTAPTDAVSYGSFDLGLRSRRDETTSIRHLIDRDRGMYRRPPIVVFYISAALRRQVAHELDKRFGYRTETIYPDLGGFALANSWQRNLK
jgi:hypothetical protein